MSLPRADLLWRNSWGMARTAVLAAAVELDVFTALALGPADAAELARRTNCSPRGMAALAGALVGIGLLTRDDHGRFAATEVARAYLGAGAAVDLGPQVLHSRDMADRWWRLADCVRSGQPLPRDQAERPDHFIQLVQNLFNGNFAAATILARELADRESFRPASVLDVGAGSAAWSLPFALADDRCRVTVLDYPQVLQVTRQYVERFKLADRYCYRGEPAECADLGREQFDLVLVGHVYHSLGAEASVGLASRAAASLRPGGLLAVAEFVVDDDCRGPAQALLFACNMLLGTAGGDTFTARQIDDWARSGGLTPLPPVEIPTGSPVRLARKL
jgi:SAM-dependent methyltransferase